MFIIKCLIISAVIFVVIALVLVASQSRSVATGSGLEFSRASGLVETAGGVSVEHRQFIARDGTELFYRQVEQTNGSRSDIVIILLHGSSAHSGLYASLAAGLADTGIVISPDIRGHGQSAPGGDVDYIGQLEHDLADLIAHINLNDNQKLVIVGHSSGGGLAVRYGRNGDLPQADGVVLLAYTYRLNTAFAPRRDFKQDLSSLPEFVVIVGENDEAFITEEYAPLLKSFSNSGSVSVIDELSHLDVIADKEVHSRIAEFISAL
ncbi:MAG: alpha/beta hydrolase [Pseudomonadota bacterium]